METVNLGNTGLKVSQIGLGTAALGRPGYMNLGHGKDLKGKTAVQDMRQQAHQMFDLAYEQGILYYDTARSYGKGEDFLAEWINIRGYSDVIIGSKWGYIYTAEWQTTAKQHEVKDHSINNLNRQLAESTGLLGEHLDLYQIHSATLETGVLDDQLIEDRLWEIKRSGIKIGLTLSGANQAEILHKALTKERDGLLIFDSVQATFNVLEQSAGSALMKAHEMGLGVIVKEGLANGRLTQRNTFEEDQDCLKLLSELAQKYDTGTDAIALAYVLEQPWSDTVLSGATTIAQLKANCDAGKLTLEETDEKRLSACARDSESYWNTRSKLEWT
ncbi:aldo/keto reductase [Roseivirga sp. BDSF3-8]|uniref:aldo/keto reductase n=1 Tax=Roseivirga sp. BDSF3-8 TaxID=3241598 RepID=UPI0035327F6B